MTVSSETVTAAASTEAAPADATQPPFPAPGTMFKWPPPLEKRVRRIIGDFDYPEPPGPDQRAANLRDGACSTGLVWAWGRSLSSEGSSERLRPEA